METKIFVNLPVKDLDRAVAFFTQLGFSFNPQFTDENATCMVVSEHIYVMLLVEKFFLTFTNKTLADTSKAIETMITLSAPNRQKVDELVDKAVAAGAATPNPAQDHGWMYGRGFEDLDGHHWDIMYMSQAAVNQGNEMAVSAN